MVDRADTQVGLVHLEGPLDEPEVVVVFNDLLWNHRGVGDVGLDAVPDSVCLKLGIVDGYLDLALHVQVLVVAPVVDVVLGQTASPQFLFQSPEPVATVLGIVLGPLAAHRHDHTAAVLALERAHLSVTEVQGEDFLFHLGTVIFRPRT